MITSKRISTISYNTHDFLVSTLEDLVESHVIEFWAFISHLPEPKDEFGVAETKQHFHLFLIPSKKIDTDLLKKSFIEPDLNNPLQPPRTVIWFETSVFGDWYMYGLHDIDYLETKGESRYYHYTFDDIETSSIDRLMHLIHTSDMNKWKRQGSFRRACLSSTSFDELVYNGFVPFDKIIAYKSVYHSIKNHSHRLHIDGEDTDSDIVRQRPSDHEADLRSEVQPFPPGFFDPDPR